MLGGSSIPTRHSLSNSPQQMSHMTRLLHLLEACEERSTMYMANPARRRRVSHGRRLEVALFHIREIQQDLHIVHTYCCTCPRFARQATSLHALGKLRSLHGRSRSLDTKKLFAMSVLLLCLTRTMGFATIGALNMQSVGFESAGGSRRSWRNDPDERFYEKAMMVRCEL